MYSATIVTSTASPRVFDDELIEILADVKSFVDRFVAFPTEHHANAVALWIVHTHIYEQFDSTPRLAVISAEKQSGKTRLLEILNLLARGAMLTANTSVPALFRTITQQPTTLLFDEVDALFGRYGKDDSSEDMRALLNAGHRKGATIPRCHGPAHAVRPPSPNSGHLRGAR